MKCPDYIKFEDGVLHCEGWTISLPSTEPQMGNNAICGTVRLKGKIDMMRIYAMYLVLRVERLKEKFPKAKFDVAANQVTIEKENGTSVRSDLDKTDGHGYWHWKLAKGSLQPPHSLICKVHEVRETAAGFSIPESHLLPKNTTGYGWEWDTEDTLQVLYGDDYIFEVPKEHIGLLKLDVKPPKPKERFYNGTNSEGWFVYDRYKKLNTIPLGMVDKNAADTMVAAMNVADWGDN
jgi:hypothetical protein